MPKSSLPTWKQNRGPLEIPNSRKIDVTNFQIPTCDQGIGGGGKISLGVDPSDAFCLLKDHFKPKQ